MTVALQPLRMKEAQSFWEKKVQLDPEEFASLTDEAKLKGFAIAGIARGDELATAYNALQKAIENGTSITDFKKECAGIFERRGWTGKRDWRVQNIFRTNIQTAYNAGRWQKQQERKEAFPYLQYNAVNDRRTRPTHRAMDGKVFPIDHPFWDTWYPPNGYRCRCSTISLTAGQVKRMGLMVESDNLTARPVTIEGQVLLPDPGFAINPGKGWLETVGTTLTERVESWPDLIATSVIKEMITGGPFGRWYQKPTGSWPVAKLQQALAESFTAESRTVLLADRTAMELLAAQPGLHPEDYSIIQVALEQGSKLRGEGAQTTFVYTREGSTFEVTLEVRNGQVQVTNFHKKSDQNP